MPEYKKAIYDEYDALQTILFYSHQTTKKRS